MKDQLFNAEKVTYLAGLFSAATDGFDGSRFQADVMGRLTELELKERIAWIAECLGTHLPGPLQDVAPVLTAALPPPFDPSLSDDDFGDFIFAPLGEFVVARGLEDAPDLVLDLLEAVTQRFSMEWAIRPMLNRWPDKTLAHMAVRWAGHDSYHVRRLVSEGTRPRLPWGQAVSLELSQPLPLLDRLHADPTRYVTRSVANHLNDIAKKDADLAMDRLEEWADQGRQSADELDWMRRHALRGLVKDGHPRALAMLGYDPDAPITLTRFDVPATVKIGDDVPFSVTLTAAQPTGALVDYVLWRPLESGKESAKVFKLKQLHLESDVPVTLEKLHKLKSNATTYRLHPGPHRIDLQVNGRVIGSATFDLRAP